MGSKYFKNFFDMINNNNNNNKKELIYIITNIKINM